MKHLTLMFALITTGLGLPFDLKTPHPNRHNAKQAFPWHTTPNPDLLFPWHTPYPKGGNDPIDPCKPNRCKNGGKCWSSGKSMKCECSSEFQGKYCQTQKDACSSNPCKNGGQCWSSGKSTFCDCTPEFEGKNCQTKIDKDPCNS